MAGQGRQREIWKEKTAHIAALYLACRRKVCYMLLKSFFGVKGGPFSWAVFI